MPKVVPQVNYEQFVFYCDCGKEIRTNEERKAKCICGKEYQIELLPHKFLHPENKGD